MWPETTVSQMGNFTEAHMYSFEKRPRWTAWLLRKFGSEPTQKLFELYQEESLPKNGYTSLQHAMVVTQSLFYSVVCTGVATLLAVVWGIWMLTKIDPTIQVSMSVPLAILVVYALVMSINLRNVKTSDSQETTYEYLQRLEKVCGLLRVLPRHCVTYGEVTIIRMADDALVELAAVVRLTESLVSAAPTSSRRLNEGLINLQEEIRQDFLDAHKTFVEWGIKVWAYQTYFDRAADHPLLQSS